MNSALLTISSVSKRFQSLIALDNCSIEIQQGDFFGLLGPNGAGKSTLMNIIIGYTTPDSGKVTMSVAGKSINDIRKYTGYTPQSIALYDELSAVTNLRIFASFYGMSKKQSDYSIAKVLEMSGLFERKNDQVQSFSGGMKRRLNLAASLLHDPELIICDEPTVGVDPQSRNAIFEFLEHLNNDGKTIIYTTHYMEEAERLCKRIAVIDHGSIITVGSLTQLMELFPYKRIISAPKEILDKYPELFTHCDIKHSDQHTADLLCRNDDLLISLISGAASRGINIQAFDIRKPALETVFLHLTGKTLRD